MFVYSTFSFLGKLRYTTVNVADPMQCGHAETQTMQTADCADCTDWVLFFYLYLNFLVEFLL